MVGSVGRVELTSAGAVPLATNKFLSPCQAGLVQFIQPPHKPSLNFVPQLNYQY